jgi:hypothetical protein
MPTGFRTKGSHCAVAHTIGSESGSYPESGLIIRVKKKIAFFGSFENLSSAFIVVCRCLLNIKCLKVPLLFPLINELTK